MVLGEEVEVDLVAYGYFDVVGAEGETVLADSDRVCCCVCQKGGKCESEGAGELHCQVVLDLLWSKGLCCSPLDRIEVDVSERKKR